MSVNVRSSHCFLNLLASQCKCKVVRIFLSQAVQTQSMQSVSSIAVRQCEKMKFGGRRLSGRGAVLHQQEGGLAEQNGVQKSLSGVQDAHDIFCAQRRLVDLR